ncbi:EamA family transporter [Candidatus Gracilibacteria bacterium]|nr:EamA family transporter [Candidatus Gracilibacteria bacterium]
MFFFLVIISMLAYSFQGTLLVRHAREIDGLSLSIYRNLSLGISMIPLLFLANKADFLAIPQFLPLILGAGLSGAISLSLGFTAVRFLPVGISTAFGNGATVIVILFLGFIFFQESLSILQAVFVGIILGSGIVVGFQKNWMPHLDERTRLGIIIRITGSLFTGLTFFLMSKVARELNPYIAAYSWELLIGIFALVLALERSTFSKQKIKRISWSKFGKILLISSPTLLGSGGFAYAITIGPVGIASAVSVGGGMFVSMILADLWYNEKLNLKKWIIILIMAASIAGLKLAGV